MSFELSKLKIPKFVKTLCKLLISVAIIFLIMRKIDERLLLKLIIEANPLWLVWTIIWFILSKIISANRFNVLLKTQDIDISPRQNLKFYWLGMYYNLLLPGGISGDGYKIKILMDAFQKPFRSLFTITLLDRITGVMALIQLGFLLLPCVPGFDVHRFPCILAFIVSIGIVFLIYRWLGVRVFSVWRKTLLLSWGVQASQIIAALGLLLALGLTAQWAEYLELFLISSVIAMIPITIGGAGARELTFLYGSQFLDVDAEKAVAIGFLFYLISTAVSLAGILFSFHKNISENLKKA